MCIRDRDSITAAARGQTVNWYLWGGSDSINRYVDEFYGTCLLYTSDAADERSSVDLGGRRIIKKKKI